MQDQPLDPSASDVAGLASRVGLGLLRFDATLRVRFANRAAYDLLERRDGWLPGRTAMEAFVDHRLEALVRAAAAGTAGSLPHASGEHVRLTVHAEPAAGGGAWVALEDVAELERLRRIRSEFIDNVSHELRTPLANVRLLTEMLADDLADLDVPKRVRERVATIDVETGHLVQMINELLDLSRMENATVQVRRDTVALALLVSATLRRLEAFAKRQGVTLASRVPSDLPPVRGDEERIDQLLMNLLHNAIKFSPGGGEVLVSADEHPDAVVVSVVDHGVGIPPADQTRVFERFYKVDRASQRGLGGTGLGLAIARHIAEAHGGSIWLDSTEGEGSTFSFSLPIGRA